MDRIEDPFKDFGPNIVGNITEYSSSTNEDEAKVDQKKKEVEEKRRSKEYKEGRRIKYEVGKLRCKSLSLSHNLHMLVSK